MKNTIKAILLLLALTLALGAFAACGGAGAEDVVIASKGSAISSLLLYGEPADLAKAAATEFNELLAENGYSKIANIRQASTVSEDAEIIIGDSDREASKTAIAQLNGKTAAAPNDLHWAFCYKDGKLAIVANSKEAYSMAFKAFFEEYGKSGSITVKSDLDVAGSMPISEYNAYVEEQERIEAEKKAEQERLEAEKKAEEDRIAAEKKKEENAKLLLEIKPLVESQRETLKTYEGQINKYTDGDPMIKLFTQYTANINDGAWGTVPCTITQEHPRLLITSAQIPALQKALKEDTAFTERFREKLDTIIDNACVLPAPVYTGTNATVDASSIHNYENTYLEIIQAKALGYLAYGDELYGYQAIYYIKNYIKTLDIKQIASDQCRQYGHVMFTAALVYDWCYDLLTEDDKTQLIAGVENCLCRGRNAYGVKMEVGFPPSGQGSVSGHGSEYQILRDYLSFAVAIYDENSSWWEYIGARVFNDYVPVRNYYFQSGVTSQGTSYATTRHLVNLYSAWIIQMATGTNPYVGLENTVESLFGYEFKPGYIFNDGDETGDYQEGRTLVSMAYITAYLYGDATMLAQANYNWNKAAFGSHYSGISTPVYLALTSLRDLEPAEDRYEGMELIQYNGHPLGQYIVHESWTDESSAAVFMRIKERSTANHEHCDSGTFEIYYKGMLTSDGGAYNNYSHEHTQYFHQATISHNGLIIYNPTLAKDNGGWYSGGQERFGGESSNLNGWLNDSSKDTGKVTGRQHGYSDAAKTKPLYAYIAGDITAAYNPATVNYVGRRMLTVYTGNEEFPMAFFVYDDISADNQNFEKRFLLQITSFDAPTVDEKEGTVITENGDGRLVLTCLSDNAKINALGGRTYVNGVYDASKSSNYLVQGRQLVPKSNSSDDGHWGRIEIVYTKKSQNASFMNVLYVTDKGNENMANVRATASENGMTGGVFNKSIAALFVTSRERATATVSCKTFGNTSMSYYVSGVAAGKWSVTVGGKSIGTFEATEEGGLLTFTAPAGEVSISPAN